MLAVLIERRDSVVTRDDLRSRLWPAETFVDFEHSLNTAVKRLRRALDDDAASPKYVETLRGHGYRFLGRIEDPAAEPVRAVDTPNTGATSVSRHKQGIAPWLAAAAVLVIGMAAVVIWWRAPATPRPRGSGHPRVMLAVLPFQNLSGAADQEYFNDGLTEETISDLGRLSSEDLGVIARTSAMTYKRSVKTAGAIGRELGVDYIVEGSVRRDGGRVRVTAQLIRVSDQTHLWARSYDRELRDLLALEGELGEAIAEQVQLKLAPGQLATLKRTRDLDPRAYEAYLKARYFWFQFRLDSLNKSIAYYDEALRWDDSYAAAYAGLAAAYSVRANLYTRPTEDYPKAKAAAEKALQLDEALPTAHSVMAAIHIFYDWDWRAADRELSRLRELDPNPSLRLQEAPITSRRWADARKPRRCCRRSSVSIRSHPCWETIWVGRITFSAGLPTQSRSSGRRWKSIRTSRWRMSAWVSRCNSTAIFDRPPRSTRRHMISPVLLAPMPEWVMSLLLPHCGKSSSGRPPTVTWIRSPSRSSA